jgi:hypothetical protein
VTPSFRQRHGDGSGGAQVVQLVNAIKNISEIIPTPASNCGDMASS